ncbi:MAG: GntR family transcriptional regulator [Planctomycetota bacterium]
MHFEVDPRSPVSPGDQLADQVRFAVAAGRLAVGERLPSVRDLARLVRLNPNTVSRAWRELELTGVLEARRGNGMYVADGAVDVARTFRTRALAERLGRAVGDALAAGLDADEVQALVADACAAWRAAEPGDTAEPGGTAELRGAARGAAPCTRPLVGGEREDA